MGRGGVVLGLVLLGLVIVLGLLLAYYYVELVVGPSPLKPERNADAAAPEPDGRPLQSRCLSEHVGVAGLGRTLPGSMSTVNSSSTGRRAVVLAGRYWSQPASSPAPQQRMFRPPRRLVSSNTAGDGSKTAAWAQLQEDAAAPLTTQDRHVRSHRTLIYRDVKAFLKEVGGDPREARYWLTQFQRASAAHAPAFAVLEVNQKVWVLLKYTTSAFKEPILTTKKRNNVVVPLIIPL